MKYRHIHFIPSPHGNCRVRVSLSHFVDGKTETQWEEEPELKHQAFTLHQHRFVLKLPVAPAAHGAKSQCLGQWVTAPQT